MTKLTNIFSVFIVFCFLCLHLARGSSKALKKSDVSDNKGNTPFFLQDPNDSMCMGPNGFGVCDESALWILTKRNGKKTYSLMSLLSPYGTCLQRKTKYLGIVMSDKVTTGSCGKTNAKNWMFEFVDQKHVKLSTEGQCLVRGKHFKNSLSVQRCTMGEFVPLVYHPTAVHENGFLIKTADDYCFSGDRFTSCGLTAATQRSLLWGVGVRYQWSGEAVRYFFDIAGDRDTCLVSRGHRVMRGSCTDPKALGWNLAGGQLTLNSGRSCVVRLADDSAAMVPCSEASEYVTMDVPTSLFLPGVSAINSVKGATK